MLMVKASLNRTRITHFRNSSSSKWLKTEPKEWVLTAITHSKILISKMLIQNREDHHKNKLRLYSDSSSNKSTRKLIAAETTQITSERLMQAQCWLWLTITIITLRIVAIMCPWTKIIIKILAAQSTKSNS